MKRIGMGLVGPGFVGAHHIDAVRRLGFVDVVAIAASTEASARRKADALGIPKAYGGYEALVADPDIHVVHNTTPNYLHAPVILAAVAHGKHVVSDKPLAMSAAEARQLWDAAESIRDTFEDEEGENTVEGDVMNDTTPAGGINPRQRGRTNA